MTTETILPDGDFLAFLPAPGEVLDQCDGLVLADRLADAGDPRERFFRAFASGEEQPSARPYGNALCAHDLTANCRVLLAVISQEQGSRRAAQRSSFREDVVEVTLQVKHPEHPGTIQEMWALLPFSAAAELAGRFLASARAGREKRCDIWNGMRATLISKDFCQRLFGETLQ